MKTETLNQIKDEIVKLYDFLNGKKYTIFTEQEANNETGIVEIMDMPIAYKVDDKYGIYEQGAVMELLGDGFIKVFLTGERYGEIIKMYIDDIPVQSAIDIALIINGEIKLD